MSNDLPSGARTVKWVAGLSLIAVVVLIVVLGVQQQPENRAPMVMAAPTPTSSPSPAPDAAASATPVPQLQASNSAPTSSISSRAVVAAPSTALASSEPEATFDPNPPRWYEASFAAQGKPLYERNCATCHGPQGQGDPNWRQKNADGSFKPPPLNGTAHTWHHPAGDLMATIMNGSSPGTGNMPAWRDILTPKQVASIIAYFQEFWPDEIYAEWYRIEMRSRGNG